MFGHKNDDNINEKAVVADTDDSMDIDKLLDDIKFEDEDDAAILAPLSDNNVPINISEDDLSSSLQPDVTDLTAGEATETPSFLNEWEELPKDDGNGIWKADTPFMEDDGLGADDNIGLDDNNIVLNIPHKTEDASETQGNSTTQDFQTDENKTETNEQVVDGLMTAPALSDPSTETDSHEAPTLQTVETEINEPLTNSTPETFPIDKSTADETTVDKPITQPFPPSEPVVSSLSNEVGYAVWYSGDSKDQYFEISRQSEIQLIEGTPECKTIHVNSGLDSYGWLVSFGNNVTMSLADVREYQLRNGSLPYTDGVITYGPNEFTFRDIERIVVYQSVRYFSYGLN